MNVYIRQGATLPEVDCTQFKGDYELAEIEEEERAKSIIQKKLQQETENATFTVSLSDPDESVQDKPTG